MLTKKQILAQVWCCSCNKLYENLQRFSREHKGSLLSNRFSKVVEFCCDQGHVWKTGYKKATKHWCRECSKRSKRILKEKLQQENKRIEEQKRLKQNALLEEARLKYLKQLQSLYPSGDDNTKDNACVMQESHALASRYAREYLQGVYGMRSQSECNEGRSNYLQVDSLVYDKIVELYKVLIISEQELLLWLQKLGKEEAKREFRRLALLLHPDKNNHPYAKLAFQKQTTSRSRRSFRSATSRKYRADRGRP